MGAVVGVALGARSDALVGRLVLIVSPLLSVSTPSPRKKCLQNNNAPDTMVVNQNTEALTLWKGAPFGEGRSFRSPAVALDV